MNMKLKRSIAMLLLVASLVSLLGIGAFATGGESASEAASHSGEQTSSTLTLSATFVPPADGGETEPAAPADPSDGGDLPTATAYSFTFYGYDGKVFCEIAGHTAGALTSNELADIESKLPEGGVAYWYGTDSVNTVTYTHAQLKNANLAADYSFYAAYLVTYRDASGSEISTEIVKSGAKPTSVPVQTNDSIAITGWTDKDGKDIAPAETTITANVSFTVKATPAAPTQNYTVTFYDYDGTKLGTVTTEGGKIDASAVPTSPYLKGGSVSGWLDIPTDTPDLTAEIYDLSTYNILRDLELHAAWRITYAMADGTEIGKELVLTGDTPVNPPTVIGQTDTPIAGWMNEKNIAIELSEQNIGSNITFTAWTRPTLVMDKSVAYVKGNADKDGNVYRFLPDGKLTRAEAAKMLYGLLSDDVVSTNGPVDVVFSDVALPGAANTPWYSEAIYTLASYGLLSGTGGGKFEPTREITRAEFINMVARIYGIKYDATASPFSDVSSSSWYYGAVVTAYEKNWITGYAQANNAYTFEPQRKITRAEAVSILNRVTGRTPTEDDKARIDGYDWRIFIDVDTNWAYYEIMQAATGCGQNIPNTGLSAGIHTFKLNGTNTYFFVNADKRFVAVKAGLNKMSNGKSYYFSRNGAGATVYSAGLRILGGKLYLLAGDGSVITEPRSGYDTRVYEYKGHMYYINKDGSLLRNGYFGQLYFGSNGAYTSGDSVLDTWINNFIDDHSDITDADTQEDMLYEAYVALRDFPKERHGYGSAGYWRYDLRTYTDQEHASLFYERAKGSCEEWAYAMVYLARRIGYKAAGASGKLGGQNNAIHVWEVIEIDDELYTFDVEQEWGFMYMYYNSKLRTDRDCWKMEYDPDERIDYGTRFAGTTYGSYYAGRYNVWSPYVYNRSTSSLGF